MRIIAGKMKGTGLYLPKNKKTRPLKDLVRESIFNLLKHSNKISFKFEKSNILDLYAGTGSFGLECASREAKSIFFVENEKEAIEILKKNIKKLKIEKKVKIFFDDVFSFVKKINILDSKFDLVFCDPPFKDNNLEKLIELIYNKNLLRKDGILIIHRNKSTKERLPKYFSIIDERIYGVSKIIFGKF
jgi:16S rRNA (guanine966-N2)-methyltransferase